MGLYSCDKSYFVIDALNIMMFSFFNPEAVGQKFTFSLQKMICVAPENTACLGEWETLFGHCLCVNLRDLNLFSGKVMASSRWQYFLIVTIGKSCCS